MKEDGGFEVFDISEAASSSLEVACDYDAAQCQPPFSRFLSGFCQDRSAAEGDWDLIDYSRSRAFARPH